MSLGDRSDFFCLHPEFSVHLENCTRGGAEKWKRLLGLPHNFSGKTLKQLRKAFLKQVHDVSDRYDFRDELKCAISSPGFIHDTTYPILQKFLHRVWGSPVVRGHTRYCGKALDCGKEADTERIKVYLFCWIMNRAYDRIKLKEYKQRRKLEDAIEESAAEYDWDDDSASPQPSPSESTRSHTPWRSLIVKLKVPQLSQMLSPSAHSPGETIQVARPPSDSVVPQSPEHMDGGGIHAQENQHSDAITNSQARNVYSSDNTRKRYSVVISMSNSESEEDPPDENHETRNDDSNKPRKILRTMNKDASISNGSLDAYNVSQSPSERIDDARSGGFLEVNTTDLYLGSFPANNEDLYMFSTHGLPASPPCSAKMATFPFIAPIGKSNELPGTDHVADISQELLPTGTPHDEAVMRKRQDRATSASQAHTAPDDSDDLIISDSPRAAIQKDSGNNPTVDPKAIFRIKNLRKELTVQLLSCLQPEDPASAPYEQLVERVKQLRELGVAPLADNNEDKSKALTFWVQMIETFCAFRRDSGFRGQRKDWDAHCAALPRDEQIVAWRHSAVMQCSAARLNEEHGGADAEPLGRSIAPVLLGMAGEPKYIRQEDLAEHLCSFCQELFRWFE